MPAGFWSTGEKVIFRMVTVPFTNESPGAGSGEKSVALADADARYGAARPLIQKPAGQCAGYRRRFPAQYLPVFQSPCQFLPARRCQRRCRSRSRRRHHPRRQHRLLLRRPTSRARQHSQRAATHYRKNPQGRGGVRNHQRLEIRCHGCRQIVFNYFYIIYRYRDNRCVIVGSSYHCSITFFLSLSFFLIFFFWSKQRNDTFRMLEGNFLGGFVCFFFSRYCFIF